MFSFFKKLFGKRGKKAAPQAPAVAPAPTATAAPSTPIPTIEVVHLSLVAILERLPADLKPLIAGQPDPGATVALPLPTILKQLPSGVVRMSLTSLHRQAHGLIKPLPVGDKRTVEVPLQEIFRHVRPEALRRRADQRHVEIPESGFNLFGDSENPYSISPDDSYGASLDVEPAVLDLTEEVSETPSAPVPRFETPRVLKMDDGLRAQFGNGNGAAHAPTAPVSRVVPTAANLNGSHPEPSAPRPDGADAIALPLQALSANWPESLRTELAQLPPETKVALPIGEVTPGLAKGKVAFTWGQIYAWLEPSTQMGSAHSADLLLLLPLKVVAPAFLSATKRPAAERKSMDVDETIPALFSDGRPAAPKAESIPAPAAEIAPAKPAPADGETSVQTEGIGTAETVAPAVAHPPIEHPPETVGQVFGEAGKENWTPAELVAGTVKLPGVAGAIVALQEGLVVSAILPDGVKSDVVAAFLPQIFARLNQYAGEMRLGDVDDLLFTTHGAHCQIYRLGYIYFAVLGKAGETLPWHELRLVTEELARQTHK